VISETSTIGPPPKNNKSESIIKFVRKPKNIISASPSKLARLGIGSARPYSGGNNMICPGCCSENEMAYSVLSNGFICMEPACGYEIEMEREEAHMVLEPEEELVCC
jgi:hypothetical protein